MPDHEMFPYPPGARRFDSSDDGDNGFTDKELAEMLERWRRPSQILAERIKTQPFFDGTVGGVALSLDVPDKRSDDGDPEAVVLV